MIHIRGRYFLDRFRGARRKERKCNDVIRYFEATSLKIVLISFATKKMRSLQLYQKNLTHQVTSSVVIWYIVNSDKTARQLRQNITRSRKPYHICFASGADL